MSKLVRACCIAVLCVSLVAGVGCTSAAPEPEPTAPAENGSGGGASQAQQLVQDKCTQCHSLERVNAASYDRAKWEETITRMEGNGLVVTPDEKAAIADYLASRGTTQ